MKTKIIYALQVGGKEILFVGEKGMIEFSLRNGDLGLLSPGDQGVIVFGQSTVREVTDNLDTIKTLCDLGVVRQELSPLGLKVVNPLLPEDITLYNFLSARRPKVLVIYHTDLDGVFSAATVGLSLEKDPDIDVIYRKHSYGSQYSLTPDDLKGYRTIYAVDISFRDFPWVYQMENLVWIDHHKTAIDLSLADPNFPRVAGIRDSSMAACELCWKSFFPGVPNKLIEYISAHDTFDKKRFDWNEVMNVHYGAFNKYGLRPWEVIEDLKKEGVFSELYSTGKMLREYTEAGFKGRVVRSSYVVVYEGIRFLAANTQEKTSTYFDSIFDPTLHDAVMPWSITPGGDVVASIYRDNDDPRFDLSVLADSFGGGGHPGAAGFQLPISDFLERFGPAKKEIVE